MYQAKRRIFPDPAVESIDGIVAMGDQLNVPTLFEAYSFGIFPWPHEDLPLLWYSPDPRGVIDFKNVKIGKSLRKFLKNETDFYQNLAEDSVGADTETGTGTGVDADVNAGTETAELATVNRKNSKLSKGDTLFKPTKYTVTYNTAFADVMEKCSEVSRPGQGGTWIHAPLKRAYLDFHKAGYAHSVEVWRQEGASKKLVGGLYGVYVGGVFAGESMFYLESNTSKLALLSLIERLKKNGLEWMDIQMVTPVTEALGGRYISRQEYLDRLEISKPEAKPIKF